MDTVHRWEVAEEVRILNEQQFRGIVAAKQ